MMGELNGKVALITGAGQGIGQGIAFSLAKRGAAVVAVGRTLEKCEGTVATISERFGTPAIAVQCDIGQLDQLDAVVSQTIDTYGRLDILVNNAVYTTLGSLLNADLQEFEKGLRVGPMATLRLMQLAHPHLKAAGGGNIINMASTSAMRWDSGGYGSYAAQKEAIRALTRAAANEWAADGIRTNVILPHAMSPALAGWIKARPDEAAAFAKAIPGGRIGECEADIGEFVAVLCSDASRYVNGQSIAVDGGQANLG